MRMTVLRRTLSREWHPQHALVLDTFHADLGRATPVKSASIRQPPNCVTRPRSPPTRGVSAVSDLPDEDCVRQGNLRVWSPANTPNLRASIARDAVGDGISW